MKKSVFIGAVCALSSTAVHAQATNVEDTQDIERVSIVGASTNLSVTAEDIEQFQANDLADIFRESPSVSVGGSVVV